MIEYNKNTYILLFAFIIFSLKINAQRVRVIDNKGTIKIVNSTVTTNITGIAPTNPLEGDIWFDTLNSEIKIYDTEPLSAPIWRNMSGYYTDNIYNIDGNLTSNRFVGGGGNQLRFSGFDRFDIDNANYVLLQSNGYFDIRATTGINLYSDTRITGNISVQGGYRDSGSNYGNVGQILSSTNTGTSWIDNTAAITGTTGSIFFAGATGNPTENNDQLFWDETNKRLQVGLAFTNNINNKLNVRGAIRTTGLNNADGTVGTPSYRFTTDKDTGMYKPAADEIGLVVGGKEAINIDETANNTTVTIKETLKLDGALLDSSLPNGNAGTLGQILSSTGTATKWITPNLAMIINKTSDYTLTLSDNGNVLTFNSTTDITLTVPTGLPIGYNISIYQIGTGKVTIQGGATILNRLSRFKTAGKDAGAGLIATGTNIFHLTGDLKK
ncbi:hypothetical protein PG913_07935 [Tenacibaculum pacificus]|uniref:hypothetical protein n=1 Tax=Tenacibaculum pacificus TaxID=3018314 RepID=UPI0022F3F8C0|nr:hypothetical protein [Tenacibaculum pacificus]WBX72835.1 hypothetical protein PG913_07935 [Tenacibaculum pacificus]